MQRSKRHVLANKVIDFAVVADEVRALASKTQDSTGEIRGDDWALEIGG